jgi:hypothetical protein
MDFPAAAAGVALGVDVLGTTRGIPNRSARRLCRISSSSSVSEEAAGGFVVGGTTGAVVFVIVVFGVVVVFVT